MATIKSYTDIEQSKKLAEILSIESADMCYPKDDFEYHYAKEPVCHYNGIGLAHPCWSLAALLKCLSEIKPQVYTPLLFPSEGKWILQFAEYGHGNMCEVSCDNPIDACYEMVLKLNELKIL